MRIIVFWGLYWGPLYFGKLPYEPIATLGKARGLLGGSILGDLKFVSLG